ncbi:MAG: RDD family protein [Candidatus Dojkabacteria bacterium]
MEKTNLASPLARIVAYLLDNVLATAVVIAVTILFVVYIPLPENSFVRVALVVTTYFGLAIVLDVINGIVLTTFTGGKTIGKALTNVRIVKEKGGRPSFLQLAVRYIVFILILWALWLFGYIAELVLIVTHKRRQTIHDLFPKTVVIKSRTSTSKRMILGIFSAVTVVAASLVVLLYWGDFREKLNFRGLFDGEPVALIGTDGPISTPLDAESKKLLRQGELEFKYPSGEELEKAREEIDKAYQTDPDSVYAQEGRCALHLFEEEADEYCAEAYREYPESPTVQLGMISLAMLSRDCESVIMHVEELARIRMLPEYDSIKAYIYASAHPSINYCDPDNPLRKILIEGAVKYSTSKEQREFYERFLP